MQTATCFNVEIAYYTHLVPICAAILLSIFILNKTKRNLLSRVFFYFVMSFSVWLVLDLISWTTINYDIISFVWSLFDYFNIIFFLYGLYFFIVLVFERDINSHWKVLGFILTLFPFYRIISGHGIGVFDQQICEIINDPPLILYLKYIEALVIFIIGFFTLREFSKKEKSDYRNRIVVIGVSLLLFFTTFAITDYISVQTNVYEIGLYGLFVMPIFLGLIVYAIVRYKAFNIEVLSAQVLVVALVMLIGSQFFFIQSTANRIMNLITFFVAVLFGISLIKSVMRDIEMQKKLRYANNRLKEIDDAKSRFLSLGTHKILNPLTVIKGYASLINEGNFGKITNELSGVFGIIEQSISKIEKGIRECLDLSRLAYHEVRKDFSKIEIGTLVKDMVEDYRIALGKDADLLLKPSSSSLSGIYIDGDDARLRQAFSIILENCIRHARKVSISIQCAYHHPTINVSIISQRDEKEVGQEDINDRLSISLTKEIIESHKGSLRISYEDEGRKARFIMSFPVIGARSVLVKE